jgi:hypothetical protein
MNIPPIELTRRLLNSGGISSKGVIIIFAYYLKFIFALPAACLKLLFFSLKIRRTKILKQPVFILGHYRSGTTYLHKLMISDKQFGYLSNYEMVCPNTNLFFGKWMQQFIQFIINKLKIKNVFFNNSIAQLTEPCEEDRYLIGKGSAYTAYWGFVFPECWQKWLNCSFQFENSSYLLRWKKAYMNVLKQITFKNKGKQLVLKNPPNTERIKYLLEMFPEAKFIYIYRSPFDLFYSMKNMYINAIEKYCLQKISETELEELIFQHFEYLTLQYEKDKNLIPPGHLTEVQYEALEANPVEVLKQIYSELSLPNVEEAAGNFLMQLQLEKQYRKFKYKVQQDTIKKVEERWMKYIHQWNYKPTELTV